MLLTHLHLRDPIRRVKSSGIRQSKLVSFTLKWGREEHLEPYFLQYPSVMLFSSDIFPRNQYFVSNIWHIAAIFGLS